MCIITICLCSMPQEKLVLLMEEHKMNYIVQTRGGELGKRRNKHMDVSCTVNNITSYTTKM